MEGDLLKDFWTPFFAYWALLGAELIILGVGLVGLVSALRRHASRERADER
jgi:hypothetical protein